MYSLFSSVIRPPVRLLTSCGVMTALLCGSAAQGDLIRLKSGGELRGKLVSGPVQSGRDVSIRTVTGALVSLSRNEVDFITRRSLVYEEYELKARLTPETVAEQWSLAEWCLSNRLTLQREKHLERIVELDPENAAAHKALGHQLRDGKWLSHDEYMQSRGYVRFRGRYITPEEKLLQESSLAEREQQRGWYGKVRVWANWLTGRYDTQHNQALELFRQIEDPSAIPALQNFLGEQENSDVRAIYVQTLRQIGDQRATQAILKMVVLDGDQGIRSQAIQAIPSAHTGIAVRELIEYLGHDQNTVVRRAGSALRTLGDRQAVPFLIEALVTTHKYRVPVELAPVGVTLGPGGAVGPGSRGPLLPADIHAALAAGIITPDAIIPPQNTVPVVQWVTVRVDQQNPEVLDALREITQVDFGYDERTWKLWWMSQNS